MNLTAIVWLYRGQTERFLDLVAAHLGQMTSEAGKTGKPLQAFSAALVDALANLTGKDAPDDLAETIKELQAAQQQFGKDSAGYEKSAGKLKKSFEKTSPTNKALAAFADKAAPVAQTSRDLIKQADHLYKLASRLADGRKANGRGKPLKALDEARKGAVEHLKQVRYFWSQAHWLQERFPDAQLRDVEGLVKLVDHKELEANDWSLTAGRYVGVAPEIEDEDFDFEATLREIHVELQGLNEEAVELAARIARNFEGLGV